MSKEAKKSTEGVEKPHAYEPLLNKLAQLYKSYNIPHPNLKEATLAQWILESGRATSDLATTSKRSIR